VGRLVKKYKADPSFVDSLRDKERQLQTRIDAVVAATDEIIREQGGVRKVAHVVDAVRASTGVATRPWFVARVLRRVMRMKYAKPRKNPYSANTECSLVLRFLFARKLFELSSTQARLFNIDESWLNDLSWNQR